MAIYKYLRNFWQTTEATKAMRERMIEWRKQPATLRVERPMRLDRARAVGYKAKQGYMVVRQRVLRGGRQRPNPRAGRRSKHNRRRKILRLNYKTVAEGRAAKKYPNMTVLNSYELGKDAIHAWYEVILVDPQHPNIKQDRAKRDMAKMKGRVERGLTSSGRKSRGLRNKGKGAEKVRPSLRTHKNRGN